jgi:argininosuccinate lyase
VQGNLMGIMAVIKGTPTTYNKDFQVGREVATELGGQGECN